MSRRRGEPVEDRAPHGWPSFCDRREIDRQKRLASFQCRDHRHAAAPLAWTAVDESATFRERRERPGRRLIDARDHDIDAGPVCLGADGLEGRRHERDQAPVACQRDQPRAERLRRVENENGFIRTNCGNVEGVAGGGENDQGRALCLGHAPGHQRLDVGPEARCDKLPRLRSAKSRLLDQSGDEAPAVAHRDLRLVASVAQHVLKRIDAVVCAVGSRSTSVGLSSGCSWYRARPMPQSGAAARFIG